MKTDTKIENTKIEQICRYCRDSVVPGVDQIVHPCKCTSYVHVSCLELWWDNHGYSDSCEICQHKYKMLTKKIFNWTIFFKSWFYLIATIYNVIAPFLNGTFLNLGNDFETFSSEQSYLLNVLARLGLV